jgi:hypothetical protein
MTKTLHESTEEEPTRYKDRNGMVYTVHLINEAKCHTVNCTRFARFEVVKGIGYPKSRQLKCAKCFEGMLYHFALQKLPSRTALS